MPQNLPASRISHLFSGGVRVALAASATVLLASSVHAAGLGQLTVLSALGQPLQAEVEVTSLSRDEASQLEVRLASPEAYQRANMELNPALLGLRFRLEQTGGRAVIKVNSSRPIHEPYVNMLLELNAPGGRMVREYTFLLDPVGLQKTQPVQLTSPVTPLALQGEIAAVPGNVALPPSPEKRPLPTQAAAVPAASAAQNRPRSQAEPPTRHRVARGETLAGIALQHAEDGIALDQMLVALQRANPEAFDGGNMNRLRSGRILEVPTALDAQAFAPTEARRIVRAQTADFNRYRNQLASQARTVQSSEPSTDAQSNIGKVTSEIQETPSAQTQARDRLELSKASGTQGNQTALTEEAISQKKALTEANVRVLELEKNIGELEALLEIKNQALAERQAALVLTPAAELATEPVEAKADAKAVMSADAADAPGDKIAEAPTVSKATPVPAAKSQSIVTEPGMIDKILESPALPGILATVLAALVGAGLLGVRRRKQKLLQEDTFFAETSLDAVAGTFGTARAAQERLNASKKKSELIWIDEPTADGSLPDPNGSVSDELIPSDPYTSDPLLAAEMHLAFDRKNEAATTLASALYHQPERHDWRLKLLEIYADQEDQNAFAAMAGELYARTEGLGLVWQRAVALGLALEPGNPLYTSMNEAELNAPAASEPELSADNETESDASSSLSFDEESREFQLDAEASANAVSFDLSTPSIGPEEFAAQQQDKIRHADLNWEEGQGQVDNTDLEWDVDQESTGTQPSVTHDAVLSGNAAATDLVPEKEAASSSANIKTVELMPREIPSSAPSALDLDFDFPGFERRMQETMQAEQKENPVLLPSGLDPEGLDFLFDAAEPVAVETTDLYSSVSTPIVAAEADLSFLELNQSGLSAVSKEAPELLDFDLSGISLELNESFLDAAFGNQTGADSFDFSEDNETYDLSTKLDLALAYQEIGDSEGARELLEEVVEAGSPEQVEKAHALLEKLG